MKTDWISCVSLPDKKPCQIPESTVLCLGNFDGVHLGHRTLLAAAKKLQAALPERILCGVFCFCGLSTDELLPDPPKHLSSMEDRLRKFADCGMEFAIFADFARIRDFSPEEFLEEILLKVCHAKALVCGINYRFGKGGAGTPELLKGKENLTICVLPEFRMDDEIVSSTRIRRLLEEDGNAEEAARLLGEPYMLTSTVEHGKELGRRLGAPTINQFFPERALIPLRGVYLTEVLIDGLLYPGVSNVGVRPSVERATRVNCETNLLSYSGSLYGKTVSTRFLARIRPERTFDSEEELQRAIENDIETAKAYFQK